MNRSRWIARGLVVGTILVVLGVGGYVGQVWWAKRISLNPKGMINPEALGMSPSNSFLHMVNYWKQMPWYGDVEPFSKTAMFAWVPRRECYETMKRVTGLDLGNDPSSWEEWLKAHPNLVWHRKQKCLVDLGNDPSAWEAWNQAFQNEAWDRKQLRLVDLPGDSTAWEGWLKSHPNLVWDETQKRLVDTKEKRP